MCQKPEVKPIRKPIQQNPFTLFTNLLQSLIFGSESKEKTVTSEKDSNTKKFIDDMFWESLQQSSTNYNEVDYVEDQFDKDYDSSKDQFSKVTSKGDLEFWDRSNNIIRKDRYDDKPWDQSNKIAWQGEEKYWDQINEIKRVEEEDEFEFVEPMVFDLVRGLGAKPGESEVNYLMIIPLNGDPATFSPGTHSINLFYKSVDL